jgi:ketosteroid isomerase-like protein
MSQRNVEVVRALFEANQAGDREVVDAALDPDVEWEDNTGLWGDWGIAHGPEGIRDAMRRWQEAFMDVQIELGEVAARDDKVVATYPMHARGRESGIEVHQAITLVWILRRRKVVRIRSYADRSAALEAAGLSE